MANKKFNKSSLEILRNIELLCFINPNNIKKFSEILKNNLNNNQKQRQLYDYIQKNYIIKNMELYNFSFILDYAKNKDKVNYLKKLYLTNNIEESIHSKINYNLPKKSTTNNDFINTVENIFINEQFKNKKLIRYDYISQNLLAIIDDLNFNKNLQWISYEKYIKYNKFIIKKRKGELDNNNEENLINMINRLDINENNDIKKINNDIEEKKLSNDSSENNSEENDIKDTVSDIEFKGINNEKNLNSIIEFSWNKEVNNDNVNDNKINNSCDEEKNLDINVNIIKEFDESDKKIILKLMKKN